MEMLIILCVVVIGFIITALNETDDSKEYDNDWWLNTSPSTIAKNSELKILTILQDFKSESRDNDFSVSYKDPVIKQQQRHHSDHLLLVSISTGIHKSKVLIDLEDLTHLDIQQSVDSLVIKVNNLIKAHKESIQEAGHA